MTTLRDFEGVSGRPLDTFFWAITISWSWLFGSCVKWPLVFSSNILPNACTLCQSNPLGMPQKRGSQTFRDRSLHKQSRFPGPNFLHIGLMLSTRLIGLPHVAVSLAKLVQMSRWAKYNLLGESVIPHFKIYEGWRFNWNAMVVLHKEKKNCSLGTCNV